MFVRKNNEGQISDLGDFSPLNIIFIHLATMPLVFIMCKYFASCGNTVETNQSQEEEDSMSI